MNVCATKDITGELGRWHQKLLTATGVFAALTVFLSQLHIPNNPSNSTATTAVSHLSSSPTYYLVLVSLGLLLLLLTEVLKSFPRENAEYQLMLFKWGFLILLFLIVSYLWEEYYGFWLSLRVPLVIFALFGIYVYFLFKMRFVLSNKLGIGQAVSHSAFFRSHSQIAEWLDTVVFLTMVIVALWLVEETAPFIIPALKL